MTWFLHCLHKWLLWRPFDLILSMCTQLTPFLHCVPAFINVYPIDSFQHHMTWFLHCVHNWLLSRPFDLIFLHSIPNWLLSRPYHLIFVLYDMIFGLCTQLTPFKTIWPNFIIVYTIDSFQDHMTWFLYSVPNQLHLSPFDLIFVLCASWLLSRPYDLVVSMCTQLTPFNTLWYDFGIVYPIDSFQDHLI